MKRASSIVLLCLIIAQSTFCAQMQMGAASLIRQFSELDLSSPYAQQFTGLLQLRLEQGSKVDEVLNVIQELLQSLKSDQQRDDMAHAEQMTKYEHDVQTLQETLERLTTELSSTNQFITVTTQELDVLKDTIKNLQTQLEILNGKEEEIRTARSADEIAYNRRVRNAERVIGALNTIIDKLAHAVFEEKDRQGVALLETRKQEILEEIRAELGHNHPIAIFVALSAKFDIPTVSRILEKLENIREAVVASLNDDHTHEVEAIENFNAIIKEINEVRARLSEDYQTSRSTFDRKTNEKIIAERTRDQLLVDIPLTQRILAETKEQMEQYHADYQSRALRRSNEIEVVQSAFNLVNDHVQRIKNQEELTAKLNS